MDLDQLQNLQRKRILFDCVSGSRAYGTAHDASDTDIRGIFAQPAHEFMTIAPPTALVADERHNTVYYSLRRALELLATANPNVLELLYMPADCVRVDSPEMARLRERRALFITRQCADTHIGYAFSQIKKARGQNKWINQPKPEAPPRKEDFCHVLTREALAGHGDAPCRPVPLGRSGLRLEDCRAARLEHAQDVFRLYRYGAAARGVFRGDALALEPIPLADERSCFVGLLLYNERAWQQASEDHRNYWHWRAQRNEERWRAQEAGELDYDAKNLMHTIRLLLSGESILTRGYPVVRFDGAQRDLLLQVRHGRLSYGEVIALAEEIKARCMALREHADLPEAADAQAVDDLLIELTREWERRTQ